MKLSAGVILDCRHWSACYTEPMIASERLYPIRRPLAAASAGVAVALLGGLIGLGGAEFRPPSSDRGLRALPAPRGAHQFADQPCDARHVGHIAAELRPCHQRYRLQGGDRWHVGGRYDRRVAG